MGIKILFSLGNSIKFQSEEDEKLIEPQFIMEGLFNGSLKIHKTTRFQKLENKDKKLFKFINAIDYFIE